MQSKTWGSQMSMSNVKHCKKASNKGKREGEKGRRNVGGLAS